jgi:hypothetical protein
VDHSLKERHDPVSPKCRNFDCEKQWICESRYGEAGLPRHTLSIAFRYIFCLRLFIESECLIACMQSPILVSSVKVNFSEYDI